MGLKDEIIMTMSNIYVNLVHLKKLLEEAGLLEFIEDVKRAQEVYIDVDIKITNKLRVCSNGENKT